METFKIEIKETLSRIIEVEANSIESAISMAENKYKDEEIVLGNDDFVVVEFLKIEEKECQI